MERDRQSNPETGTAIERPTKSDDPRNYFRVYSVDSAEPIADGLTGGAALTPAQVDAFVRGFVRSIRPAGDAADDDDQRRRRLIAALATDDGVTLRQLLDQSPPATKLDLAVGRGIIGQFYRPLTDDQFVIIAAKILAKRWTRDRWFQALDKFTDRPFPNFTPGDLIAAGNDDSPTLHSSDWIRRQSGPVRATLGAFKAPTVPDVPVYGDRVAVGDQLARWTVGDPTPTDRPVAGEALTMADGTTVDQLGVQRDAAGRVLSAPPTARSGPDAETRDLLYWQRRAYRAEALADDLERATRWHLRTIRDLTAKAEIDESLDVSTELGTIIDNDIDASDVDPANSGDALKTF